MSNLKSTLESLSAEFVAGVLRAMRQASLDDLANESAKASAPAVAAPRKAAAPVAAKAPKKAARASGGGNKKAPKGKDGARLARRSPEDIQRIVDSIVELLQQHPNGLRSEQIREKLGLTANEMPRPLSEGLESKRLTKDGEKRKTTYFAKSSGTKKK